MVASTPSPTASDGTTRRGAPEASCGTADPINTTAVVQGHCELCRDGGPLVCDAGHSRRRCQRAQPWADR